MRPLHLILAATVLLSLCAWLILLQPWAHDPAPRACAAASAPTATSSGLPDTQAVVAASDAPAAAPANDTPESAVTQRHSPASTPAQDSDPSTQGRAIRLADNVQLPAALMTPDGPDLTGSNTVAPAVAEANRGISNTFYQTLAASPTSRPATREQSPAVDAEPLDTTGDDQDTVVIQPGPEVERARDIANETYRALFGDEAYNRQTMNSAIEVHLPVAADSGQP